MPKKRQPKYQVLPDLSPEEFESLKTDIAANGLDYPVIQDEKGRTLDGHQRERALKELNVTNYPTKTISGLSEEEKFDLALRVNIKRRHLTSRQKRDVIGQQLRRTPEISNSWLAEIVGVDCKTVQAARRKLESTLEIPRLENFRCKDGKSRRYPSIQTERSEDTKKAQELLQALDGSAPNKTLTLKRAEQLHRQKRRREARDQEITPPAKNARIQIHHCDFRELTVKAKSVQLIFTDPPWEEKALDLWPDLANFAKRVLAPGGLLLAYVPQSFMPQVMEALGEQLHYQWCCGMFRPGSRPLIATKNIMTGWQPIVMFSKGKRAALPDTPFNDFVTAPTDSRSKQHHPWEQNLVEPLYYIKQLTKRGDLVCDPMLGGGTTAVACKSLGRKFIGCDIDKAAVAMSMERLDDV